MSRIELLRHFSIPIYSAMVDGFGEKKGAIVEALRAHRATSPGRQLTNRNSWHSELDLHKQEDPSLAWACARIDEIGRAAVRDVYGADREPPVKLVECWAVIGGRGAWHTAHNHYPRPWSGVLYVEAERSAASDPHDRAGKIEFINPVSIANAFFSPQTIAYGPKDGLMLLFPGALQHMVHPTTVDEERIIISFNFG